MARIRTVKPEFLTDSKTGTLTDRATKLFIGLLIHSDDYGVIEFDPIALKARIFPFSTEDYKDTILKPLLDEILPRELAIAFDYSPSGDPPFRQYLFIRNFSKHQRVDRPGNPLIPGWGKRSTPETFDNVEFDEDSTNARRTLDEDSTSPRRRNGSRNRIKTNQGLDLKAGPVDNSNIPPPTTLNSTKNNKNNEKTPVDNPVESQFDGEGAVGGLLNAPPTASPTTDNPFKKIQEILINKRKEAGIT